MSKTNTTIDSIFKIGVLVIGIALVVVYFMSSQNSRYQSIKEGMNGIHILDTKNGLLHIIGDDGSVAHFDFVNNHRFVLQK